MDHMQARDEKGENDAAANKGGIATRHQKISAEKWHSTKRGTGTSALNLHITEPTTWKGCMRKCVMAEAVFEARAEHHAGSGCCFGCLGLAKFSGRNSCHVLSLPRPFALKALSPSGQGCFAKILCVLAARSLTKKKPVSKVLNSAPCDSHSYPPWSPPPDSGIWPMSWTGSRIHWANPDFSAERYNPIPLSHGGHKARLPSPSFPVSACHPTPPAKTSQEQLSMGSILWSLKPSIPSEQKNGLRVVCSKCNIQLCLGWKRSHFSAEKTQHPCYHEWH